MTFFENYYQDVNLRREWLQTAVIENSGDNPTTFSLLPELPISLPILKEGHRWLQHREENFIVLAKTGIGHPYGILARQKIAADLGTILELPVPGGVIWKPVGLYHFVTPLVFPNPAPEPTDDMLRADPYFPAMAIFDWWIRNRDREKENVVHNTQESVSENRNVYVDYEHCLEPMVAKRAFFGSAANFFKKFWFAEEENGLELCRYALQQMTMSPTSQKLMDDIENMPLEQIKEVVERLPNELFVGGTDDKDIIVQGLVVNRVRIRRAFERASLG